MAGLDDVLRRALVEIDRLTAGLVDGSSGLNEWETAMGRTLTTYHAAAYMVGQNRSTLTTSDMQSARAAIGPQLRYLAGFTQDIAGGRYKDSPQGLEARARLYAGALKESYWRGRTRGMELPGYPAQGTQCRTNCRCEWQIETLDSERGDYNAYWRRHVSDSCATCLDRESFWNPYPVRGGVGGG